MLRLLIAFCWIVSPALMAVSPKTVKLVPEMTLGGMDAPDIALFSATAKLAVAPDGSLYVLDSGHFRISVFNPSGEFQFQFGREGKGPGEFVEPVAIALDDQQQVFIFDTGLHRYTVFDAKGKYVREKRFPNNIHGVFTPSVFSSGSYAMTVYRIKQPFQLVYQLALQDKEAQDITSFHDYLVPPVDWGKSEQPGFWSGYLKDQFIAMGSEMPLSARAGERLLVMEKNAYEGQIVNAKGEVVQTFKGEHKPRAMSDEAKYALCEPIWQDLAANPALSRGLTTRAFNDALNDLDEFQVVPPVAAVAGVGENFAVLTSYDPLSRTGQLDFWSPDGKLLANADYKGTHQFLTGINGYLFSLGYNEDEDIVITRFKVEGL
jgi:hypothetical protein